MNKVFKLIVLIIISLSVYFIYNKTENSKYTITNIGDKFSMGINPYGVRDKGYVELYKESLTKEKKQIIIDNTYSNKKQTITNTLFLLKNTPEFKRKLYDSNLVIISLGYNDMLYNNIIEDNTESISNSMKAIKKEYNDLINEITKYYHNNIIVVGYYKQNTNNQDIIKLNKLLKSNKQIQYINTFDLLINDKYFPNPDKRYPNSSGYNEIAKKILSKTLEIY